MINAVNEQFSRFVNFAQERFDAGKTKAIATKGDIAAAGGTPLEERGIKVTDKSDWVGKVFFRKDDAKMANNEVRELFKKTIVDMFGGASRYSARVLRRFPPRPLPNQNSAANLPRSSVLQELAAKGDGDGLGAVCRAEFFEDRHDVVLHSVR